MTGPRSENGRLISSRSDGRNRVALGTWRGPRDGLVRGFLEVDVTDTERWCAERSGVTLTHVVGAALARAIAAVPDANSRVVLGRVRRRPSVDISYVVDIGRGRDMRAVCVRDADRKSPRDAAREVYAGARRLRRGVDPDFGRSMAAARRFPRVLTRPGMAVAGFVTGGLGVAFPPLQLPAHPFGSAIVSSVGAWGLAAALPPAAPFVKLGLVVIVGSVEWRPRVRDGAVVPRRATDIGVTIDHRLVDGAQIGALAAIVRAGVERPWETWQ